MKRIFNACISFVALSFISSSAWSYLNKPIYFTIGAGGFYPQVSGDNFIGTGSGWPDDHYRHQSISSDPTFYFGGGYSWDRQSDWFPRASLELQYSYVSSVTVKGSIDQYSLPGFTNYSYQYDMQFYNVLGVAKLDIYNWHGFMPFIIGGAGFANYATSNYTESPAAGITPRVSPGFTPDGGTNFAYSLGLGLDYAWQTDWMFHLEFNHQSLGTINTGKGADYASLTGNYSNESLKNTVSANTYTFGVSYYIA
jgi:opacity protein-like surface antigen